MPERKAPLKVQKPRWKDLHTKPHGRETSERCGQKGDAANFQAEKTRDREGEGSGIPTNTGGKQQSAARLFATQNCVTDQTALSTCGRNEDMFTYASPHVPPPRPLREASGRCAPLPKGKAKGECRQEACPGGPETSWEQSPRQRGDPRDRGACSLHRLHTKPLSRHLAQISEQGSGLTGLRFCCEETSRTQQVIMHVCVHLLQWDQRVTSLPSSHRVKPVFTVPLCFRDTFTVLMLTSCKSPVAFWQPLEHSRILDKLAP